MVSPLGSWPIFRQQVRHILLSSESSVPLRPCSHGALGWEEPPAWTLTGCSPSSAWPSCSSSRPAWTWRSSRGRRSATAVGLAGLLRASAVAFTALKLLGAAYLCFLGLQSLWASFRGGVAAHGLPGGPASPTARAALPAGRAFRQGLVNNLLNPKIAVFFTSFLPQFVDPSRAILPQTVLLGAIHLALSVVWLLGYAAVASRAADLLRRPRVGAALERLTGAVLIGFGVRLATERQ